MIIRSVTSISGPDRYRRSRGIISAVLISVLYIAVEEKRAGCFTLTVFILSFDC